MKNSPNASSESKGRNEILDDKYIEFENMCMRVKVMASAIELADLYNNLWFDEFGGYVGKLISDDIERIREEISNLFSGKKGLVVDLLDKTTINGRG